MRDFATCMAFAELQLVIHESAVYYGPASLAFSSSVTTAITALSGGAYG